MYRGRGWVWRTRDQFSGGGGPVNQLPRSGHGCIGIKQENGQSGKGWRHY